MHLLPVNSQIYQDYIVELLFCLPLANGHVECMFSSHKLIKSEKRCCLKWRPSCRSFADFYW